MTNLDDIRRLEKLRRLSQLRKSSGICGYEPHRKQELFHSAAWADFRYLRTGNRFGKSTAGACEDVAFALGERLWIPEGDARRRLGIPQRSTKGLIIVADWDKAREIYTSMEEGESQGKIFQFLPKAAFHDIHKNQAGEIDCIQVKSIWGGISHIYIDTVRSYMGNPMGQESSHWDWIHVDEPCPKNMWVANSRGLIDNDGKAWFTCTPIAEQWINELFIPRSRLKENFDNGQNFSKDALSTWVMTGTTFDNTSLSEKSIKKFEAQLTEGERASRIDGRPFGMQGAVYSMFDREFHMYDTLPHGWKDFDDPPEDYTIRVAVDPHPKTPHAVLFAATAPTGQTFFYTEYFQHVMIDDLVDVILYKLHGRQPFSLLLDRIAFNQDPITGATWADSFYKKGLMVTPASKELTHGIVAVQNALSRKTGETLHFCSALNETLYEFDAYIWDPKKENKPKDANDHMMECLYRLVLNGLSWIAPEKSDVFRPGPLPLTGELSFETSDQRHWFEKTAA